MDQFLGKICCVIFLEFIYGFMRWIFALEFIYGFLRCIFVIDLYMDFALNSKLEI